MRNEELDMKKIDHFVIRTYLEDGEIWETIRHTRVSLPEVSIALISCT